MLTELAKYSKKFCPDQYDAYADKWCMVEKEVAELKINKRNFHKYDKPSPFDSKTKDS